MIFVLKILTKLCK